MTLAVTPKLQRLIDFAGHAHGTRETARQAMNCLDLTSLKGEETRADILELCDIARHNRLATVCIYPEHVVTAAASLRHTNVGIATVINFPYGTLRTQSDQAATPGSTAEDIKSAIAEGASQVDVVLPYKPFTEGNSFPAYSLLQAARDACPPNSTFKVILEAAAFGNSEMLRHACRLAIQRGADCLKTSTGKHPAGGVNMAIAAILLEEAQQANRKVGCKLTGGIKTNDDCARYMTLARSLRGWNVIQPQLFRIGASSLLENLIMSLGSKHKLDDWTPTAA